MDFGEEEFVQLSVPEVFVYKIPPKTSAAGHKASDWKDQVWVGKLQVVTKGKGLVIKLVAADTGKVFAVAPVRKDGPPAVEKVSDSSRYFCLRIENDKGAHAFIGIGFNQRSDAFDFNVALQDAMKDTEDVDARAASLLDLGPAGEDFSLKAGEKITIKIGGTKPATHAAPAHAPAPAVGGFGRLAAPPAPAPAPAAGSNWVTF